jgi:hypothetical protein
MAMKTVVWAALAVLIAAIVACFALDRFMIAYGLIFFLITVLTAIGQVYGIDNHLYLDKKAREYDENKRW